MISFSNLSINDVPETWIYENYLGLSEMLTGQDIRIKSIFNPKDSKPSMFIYYKNGYRWKDFSSGKSGNAIQLVIDMFGETYNEAVERILNDYSGKPQYKRNIVIQERYNVNDIVEREWQEHDIEYWSQFHISTDILDRYNVRPLKSFTLSKKTNSFSIERKYLYGYYNNEGIYKIYQPFIKDRKFMKIKSYIQGTEQLKGYDNLIITKSLKDLMCLSQLYPSTDYLAVDSENTFLDGNYIQSLKDKYKKILVMFDNDKAGIDSMNHYKDKYNLDYLLFPFAKDIADSVKLIGFDTTKIYLTNYLNNLLL